MFTSHPQKRSARHVGLVILLGGSLVFACGDDTSSRSLPDDDEESLDSGSDGEGDSGDPADDDRLDSGPGEEPNGSQPDSGDDDPSNGVSFETVHAILTVKCSPCHAGAPDMLGGRQHAHEDIEVAFADIDENGAAEIGILISNGFMPPSNAPNGPLTANERSLIVRWIDEGAER